MTTPAPVRSRIHILGAASALGAPHPGAALAPQALRTGGLTRSLVATGLEVEWGATLHPPALAADGCDMHPRLEANAVFARSLADAIAHLPSGAFPLVLGGDHAIAAGTWRGVGRRLGHAPGLIWIDAHLDSHTAATTHSGNIHGMPLAALLGEGDAALTAIPGPTLDPKHCCIIGARAWEPEELALLQRKGVRIFSMNDVQQRGLNVVFAEALANARSNGCGFGLSIDLDALDPVALPAVTCPEPGGIAPAELAAILPTLRTCADFVALEIVEYRPDLDPDGHSARWVTALASAALAPDAEHLRELERTHGAANYAPLPAVFQRGEGAYLWDTAGRRYIDMMSAYSAVSFGHSHPRLVQALIDQAQRLALTSRAFSSDRLPLFLRQLCATFGYEQALPVNTGLEGSTFGGNPLAAAVGNEVLALLAETRPWERAAHLGTHLMARLRAAALPGVREIRGRGLLVGVAFDPDRIDAGTLARDLLDYGIATRDTNGNVIRLAPPLTIRAEDLDTAIDRIIDAIHHAAASASRAAAAHSVAKVQ